MKIRACSHSALAFLILLVWLCPSTAGAHGVMRVPDSRAVGFEGEDYQFCFGTPGCECGDYPTPGEIVATFESGQIIDVTIDITRPHPSDPVFRFQLCPTGEQSPECFLSGEFATVDFEPSEGLHNYQIQLPEGVVCDPCVLRWKWDYGFLSCADVRIVAGKVPVEYPTWSAIKATYR